VFIYNGTYFVLISGGLTAASGSANNLLMISSGGSIVDSGIPYTYTVTNGNTHDHLGGDGAQIAHSSLSGSGTNTHATIDSHIANISNPHTTTASQVGAATTSGSNAFTAENSFRGMSLGYGSGSVSSNTILGVDSLSVNTTGSRCVAMGYQALKANTDGNNNTAFGYYALKANQGGDYNIALGSNTLIANTTGNSNIAIGDTALDANVGGHSNIAVGDTSLSANIGGSGNTGIGDNSLASNTSGDYNTGIGKNTLGSVTTGDNNSALGEYAGYSLTSGSHNVFLGDSAGYTASQNGSVVNSVAIGYKSYTTLNDTIVIGGSAIVGVGVGGKFNPAFMLDVNGSVNIPTGSTYNINGSPLGGISNTITFYAGSASGGTLTILNTVTVLNGLITSWTQV
jgi:hypothetical protein